MTGYAINPAEIGSRIRELRKSQGKTQAYYADLLFISASYLALIESGKRVPTLEVLVQIAQVSGVSVDYLIFGTQSPLDENQLHFNRLCSSHSREDIKKALQLTEFYLNL